MIPKECKRLAEVDFPIAEVSKHAAREKSIRHGHPSTLHLWWARRPLASSRAVLMALLLPDPCDEHCPDEFRIQARKILGEVRQPPKSDEELQKALLKFIATFASWDMSSNPTYLRVARNLVKAAHSEETPLVVDPFSGGGSIPLEALRLGCDAFATDLNPVALMILKVMLEDIPRHGPELVEELRRAGDQIKAAAEKELADLYPVDPDGSTPITYLWVRTARCEAPNCGAEIPLLGSLWLARKTRVRQALRTRVVRPEGETPRVEFEIFQPTSDKDVSGGTVSRAKAGCLCCGVVLPGERLKAQMSGENGGANPVFDEKGQRVGGARITAVVTVRPGARGRHYRLPTEADYEAVRRAQERVEEILAEWERSGKQGLCPVPNEPTPPGGGSGASRAFSVQRYGMLEWGHLFAVRQQLSLTTFARLVGALDSSCKNATEKSRETIRECLALLVDRVAVRCTSNCIWDSTTQCIMQIFNQGQALPFRSEYAEMTPLTNQGSGWETCIDYAAKVVAALPQSNCGQVQLADATHHPIPDQAADVWFTDPPYYDAIPYSDLSDFFFVWLKRTLPGHPLLRDPFDPRNPLSPKTREAVQDETKKCDGRTKDRDFFEDTMGEAFTEGRRILHEDGVGSVVFAHKTTEGWEALLSGMIRGGWTITGSWPIATESRNRLRAKKSAALETSVHLICRPRPEDAPVGDWADVLRELPVRVAAWIERLQGEGIRGADLVFACIGPALEIFSRYRMVADPQERPIPLGGDPQAKQAHERGYLSYVWEVVGRAALEQVLDSGDATTGALEEDARLTALFLWTMQSTEVPEEDEKKKEDDENALAKVAAKGFSLPFDVVRRFAQPMGIDLRAWTGRTIDQEKGVVRLLPVAERAEQLFGGDGARAAADWIESDPEGNVQGALFPEVEAAPKKKGHGRGKKASIGADAEIRTPDATTLDRVHAAMLLQRSGQANALRKLLKAEQDRGPEFLRLANALSALYPKGAEEKRLLDAMLLAVPR